MNTEPKYRLKWIVRYPTGRVYGSQVFTPQIPGWIFPKRGTRGRWSREERPLLCRRGWHVCGIADERNTYDHRPRNDEFGGNFPNTVELWVVEVAGRHQSGDGKEAWSRIRGIQRLRRGIDGPMMGCVS